MARIEYFPLGDYDNVHFVECFTKFRTINKTSTEYKKAIHGEDVDTDLHVVSFYMNNLELSDGQNGHVHGKIQDIFNAGLRQVGYLGKYKPFFETATSWVDGKLTQQVVDAIQKEASALKVEPDKPRKTRKSEAQIRLEAIADLAAKFDMTTEEVEAFLAAKAKKKK